MSQPEEITQLLLAWRNGDDSALERLIPLVYDELYRVARGYMNREQADHTLQATALVNEVYLRLIDAQHVEWQNRIQFFGISARLMRQILVDVARQRQQQKRGGEVQQVSLDEALTVSNQPTSDLVALDDALNELAKLNQRQCQVVEMRFFGGLSEEEIAEVLQISPRTVRNDWSFAKVWLLRQLNRQENHDT